MKFFILINLPNNKIQKCILKELIIVIDIKFNVF